jgi:RNA polymerase sigma-70 factor, ECF subfamily
VASRRVCLSRIALSGSWSLGFGRGMRARSRRWRAFEALFAAHYQGMCALAYRFIRSRQAAEDIVSNVFRRLWLHRSGWEPRGRIQIYLFSATRNESLNLIRQLRRERGLEERLVAEAAPAISVPEPAADQTLVTRELASAVERASAELPPRCREVFRLRWREGLAYKEIAERMRISVKTVEMQMTRALKAIRERVRAE